MGAVARSERRVQAGFAVALARYGCAVGSIALATWLRLELDPALGLQYPYATLFFAVLVTAGYGGFGPAVTAAALGALFSKYFLIPPRGSFAFSGWEQRLGMALYATTSLGIAVLGGAIRAARWRAEASNDQLEARVQERTAELSRTNESLRESRAQFETAFESLSEGLVVSGLDGQLLYWNRAAVAMHGFSSPAEGLRALPEFGEIFQLETLDGVVLPLDQWPLSRVLRGEQLRGLEIRVRRFDQDWQRIFSYGGSLVRDQGGRAFLAVVSMADISERKWAEQAIVQLNTELERRVIQRTEQLEAANTELRESRASVNSLFESLPGLYLVLTPELMIVAVSDAYLKATLTTREGILGRQLFDVFPDNPGDPGTKAVSALRASLDRVMHNGAADTMAIQKHDVRGPDGVFVERYWSPINSPMFGADRQIKYIVHRVEEVTEFVRQKSRAAGSPAELSPREQQMEAEIFQSSQSLEAANRQLEAANKELEAFSYSVSHDLRAPLRTVDGFSQALLEDFGPQLPEEGQRQVRTIREGAQRMGALIDDLLAFSRLGRQALSAPVAVDMDRLVREALEELLPERQGRQVEIRAAALPPSQGDSALLKQVWANLLSNAIKYTRKREHAVVEIGSTVEDGETGYFVRDNGTGFDMRYAQKLFGVFQRLHRAEEFEGTGVGLAIVQRIVQRHDGRVWAESAPDRGATFHFTLPRGADS